MTDIRAVFTDARLEIFVSYPEAVKSALAQDDAVIASAHAAMPEHARPHIAPYYRSFSPHAEGFAETIEWGAIRSEFARKAKKIGLTAQHDVSFKHERDGLLLWCRAVGRS